MSHTLLDRILLTAYTLATCCSTPLADEGDARRRAFTLISNGTYQASIIHGPDIGPVERIAVAHLVAGIQRDGGATLPATDRAPTGPGGFIVVGTVQSNPFLADLADRFKLPVEDLPPESFLLRTITDDNRHYLCIAGRDGRGVLYGAQETFGQVITGTPHGELYVTECELRRNRAVAVLGTHSLTCWGLAPRYDREA